jgi:hypothetical protein
MRGLSQWVQLYTGAQINFGDLTPYIFNMGWENLLDTTLTLLSFQIEEGGREWNPTRAWGSREGSVFWGGGQGSLGPRVQHVASSPSSNFQHSQPVEAAGRTHRERASLIVPASGLHFFNVLQNITFVPQCQWATYLYHICRLTISCCKTYSYWWIWADA